MTAKNAELRRSGSHHITDDVLSQCADGIGKEQVFLYFSATWRGKAVVVTMQADRYAASNYDEKTNASTNKLTAWRTYASQARFEDLDKNGGRGEDVSGTARSALGKLCEPLVMQWLDSPGYVESFQAALAHMIMRKFRDDYSASRRVREALTTFRGRLSSATSKAIGDTLAAYDAYETAKAHAFEVIGES